MRPTKHEIAARIDAWHSARDGASLIDALGWTEEEYRAYVRNPSAVPERPLPSHPGDPAGPTLALDAPTRAPNVQDAFAERPLPCHPEVSGGIGGEAGTLAMAGAPAGLAGNGGHRAVADACPPLLALGVRAELGGLRAGVVAVLEAMADGRLREFHVMREGPDGAFRAFG